MFISTVFFRGDNIIFLLVEKYVLTYNSKHINLIIYKLFDFVYHNIEPDFSPSLPLSLYVFIDCNQHICRNNASDLDCTNYHVKPVNLKFYTKTVKTALSFKNLVE